MAFVKPKSESDLTELPNKQLDWTIVIITSIVAVIGAQMGAAFMASKVKSKTLAQIFALVLVGLALYRIYMLL